MLRKLVVLGALLPVSVTAAEKQVTLHIDEMTCQLCAYLVNKELRAVEGVVSTKANLKDKSVKVVASNQVEDQALLRAVDKLHYHAVIMPAR